MSFLVSTTLFQAPTAVLLASGQPTGPLFQVSDPTGLPSWLPTADGVAASDFADYRTEGLTNRYWNASAQQANAQAWWTSRASSGTPTFARASSAYGVPSTGLLTSYGSAVARRPVVDPPNISKGLGMQYEGARTNILLQSNALTTTWLAQGGSVAQNATGPDGTTSAWTFTPSVAGTIPRSIYQKISSGLNSGVVTSSSYYVKAGTGRYAWITYGPTLNNYITAVFDLLGGPGVATETFVGVTSGTITSTSIQNGPNGFMIIAITGSANATNGYYEIGVTGAGTGNTLNSSGEITSAIGSGTIVIADAQAEAAAFPASYIATTTGSVTRAADSQSLTRTAPTSIGKLLAGRTPASAATSSKFLWAISDGTANNYVGVYYNTSGHIIAEMNKATVITSLDLGVVAVNTDFVVAFNASSGNLAASLNGGTVVSDAGAGALPAGLTNETEGQLNSGSQWFGTQEGSAEWTLLSNSALQSLSGSSYWA